MYAPAMRIWSLANLLMFLLLLPVLAAFMPAVATDAAAVVAVAAVVNTTVATASAAAAATFSPAVSSADGYYRQSMPMSHTTSVVVAHSNTLPTHHSAYRHKENNDDGYLSHIMPNESKTTIITVYDPTRPATNVHRAIRHRRQTLRYSSSSYNNDRWHAAAGGGVSSFPEQQQQQHQQQQVQQWQNTSPTFNGGFHYSSSITGTTDSDQNWWRSTSSSRDAASSVVAYPEQNSNMNAGIVHPQKHATRHHHHQNYHLHKTLQPQHKQQPQRLQQQQQYSPSAITMRQISTTASLLPMLPSPTLPLLSSSHQQHEQQEEQDNRELQLKSATTVASLILLKAANTPSTFPVGLSGKRRPQQYNSHHQHHQQQHHHYNPQNYPLIRQQTQQKMPGVVPSRRRFCSARDVATLVFEAPTVFEGKVKSMSADRRHNFSVTFEVVATFKEQPQLVLPHLVRLQFEHRNTSGECDIYREHLRPRGFVRDLEPGRNYLLFVEQQSGDIGNFSILGRPVRRTAKTANEAMIGVNATYGKCIVLELLTFEYNFDLYLFF